MAIIKFIEEGHRYLDENNNRYESVTTLIGRYKQPFDSEYWSLYKAVERYVKEKKGESYWFSTKKSVGFDRVIPFFLPKIYDKEYLYTIQKTILQEWEDKKNAACEAGTAFHKERENNTLSKIIDNGLPVVVRENSFLNLHTGVYTELILWNETYEKAGQADKVYIDGEFVDIDDYKTNETINFKSFKHFEKGYQMMNSPINHIMDCNFFHYTIQLSIYAYFLECKGFKVRNLRLLYNPTKDANKQDKSIPITYRRKEVIDLLNHDKKNRIH